MQTVVVEVRGGVVQAVFGNEEVRVVLVDWDDAEAGGAYAREFPTAALADVPAQAVAALATIAT